MSRRVEHVVVVGIGITEAWLEAVADQGEKVVVVPRVAAVPPDLLSHRAVVLVVTTANFVEGARAAFGTTPILALVEASSDAPGAVAAGADYTLPIGAEAGYLLAVLASAQREAPARRQSTPPEAEAAALGGLGSVAALRSSEQRYRTLMESAADAILVVDYASGRIIEANPSAVALFRYERAELRQMTPRMLAGPGAGAVVDRVAEALRETGKAVEHRHPLQRKDGSRIWATIQLSTFHFMGQRQYMAVIRDVSDQVARELALDHSNRQLAETQNQLQHASRMAALGQMAAGVAHEINNPLQSILAGVEELAAVTEPSSETAELVDDMRAGAERIRLITRSLLPFARVSNAKIEPVDINELVEWAARVTANDIRHRARLELDLRPVPPVLGERSRLAQLVTHLLTNAAHAIDEGASNDNVISIATAASGGHVRLSVADTGSGIAEENRGRVFDPFFTTKPREVGTGLGLALCAEIVARQHGSIAFQSVVGAGTTFVVTLADAVHEETPKPARASVVVPRARRPRLLLVDDEEAVLRTFKRFLREFDVVTAAGGSAAIGILSEDSDFDIILCDLMMPNVDGPMVHARVEEIAPHLTHRMVFCSGGAFTARARTFLERIPNLVLDKPIGSQQLLSALDSVLRKS